MTPEQQAAYVMAMAACMNAEVAAMQAANVVSVANTGSPSYSDQDFLALIDKYGIHHNVVMGWFR